MNVYCVFLNADLTEGRGPMLLNSVWSSKPEAIKYANSLEPYGVPGQFAKIEEKLVLEKYEDKRAENLKKAKESGLSKLTKLEKEALGL